MTAIQIICGIFVLGLMAIFFIKWFNRMGLRDWQNTLQPEDQVLVKCNYLYNGKIKYYYLPAKITEKINDFQYKVEYHPEPLDDAIEILIDMELQVKETPYNEQLYMPMSEEKLMTINTKDWE